jgi:hypothetical protein
MVMASPWYGGTPYLKGTANPFPPQINKGRCLQTRYGDEGKLGYRVPYINHIL